MPESRNRPILYEVAGARKRRFGWGLLSNREARKDEKPAAKAEPPRPAPEPDEKSTSPAERPARAPEPAPAPPPEQPPAAERPKPEKRPAPVEPVEAPPPVAGEHSTAVEPQFTEAATHGPAPRNPTIPRSQAYHIEGDRRSLRTPDLSQMLILGAILVAVVLLVYVAIRSTSGGPTDTPPPPAVGDSEIRPENMIQPRPRQDSEVDRGGAAVPAEPQPADPRPPVQLKRGYHYIVVQYFPRSAMDAAEAAARFLLSRGVECAILPPGADIRLLVTEPFLIDQDNPTAARRERARGEEWLERVRELGKEYFKVGGYDFAGAKLLMQR